MQITIHVDDSKSTIKGDGVPMVFTAENVDPLPVNHTSLDFKKEGDDSTWKICGGEKGAFKVGDRIAAVNPAAILTGTFKESVVDVALGIDGNHRVAMTWWGVTDHIIVGTITSTEIDGIGTGMKDEALAEVTEASTEEAPAVEALAEEEAPEATDAGSTEHPSPSEEPEEENREQTEEEFLAKKAKREAAKLAGESLPEAKPKKGKK